MDYRLLDAWLKEAMELPSPKREQVVDELKSIINSLIELHQKDRVKYV